jgi:sulfonate transport system substrate-binding protein
VRCSFAGPLALLAAPLLALVASCTTSGPDAPSPSSAAVAGNPGTPTTTTTPGLEHHKVSDKSVAWLKEKGWWPLTIGYFADVPGYAVHYPVMRDRHLLEDRGLEVNYVSFLSGPPILEAFLAGQTQATAYGDFPFWNTVDKGVPAVAYAVTGVNNEAALVVPPDSPFQTADDLAKAGHQLVIGTTLGSYCEFYLLAMGAQKHLAAGTDYRLAGMSMREAQLVPKGVDAVAIWDPHVSFALEKGLGRRIDDVFPYYFATGYEFARREISENAPDVVQALADASIEAVLAVRADPDAAAALYVADPKAKAWSKEAVRAQIDRYVTLYKPTYKYLDPAFWSVEDARGVAAQAAAGRLTHARDAADLRRDFAPEYLADTFARLGWAVPAHPVFLPPGWAGEVGKPPYPEYWNARTLTTPQVFPEPGDLVGAKTAKEDATAGGSATAGSATAGSATAGSATAGSPTAGAATGGGSATAGAATAGVPAPSR